MSRIVTVILMYQSHIYDGLCDLVVRVPGCRSRSLLRLVSSIEELLGRTSSGSDLESLEYGRGDPLR
jgi:hypothetical protein